MWVGGVALALGGLFLVRYSIEQGWLGPGARVAAGALLALALIGAGERLRRRDLHSPLPGIPSAHVPGVLTAAGSSTAFATAYAAYGLYGFIGPGTAFAALGAVAILTLVAASLHGPALAALGLVAALGSPLLVETREPNPGALAFYLLFATFAAYGVARLRLWRWLAVAGAAGAIVWALLLLAIEAAIGSVMAHVLLQTGLAGLFLVADPYRRVANREARPDPLAGGVLVAFAAIAVLVALAQEASAARPVFAGTVAFLTLGLALRFPSAAMAAAGAALIVAGTLLVWPVEAQVAAEPTGVLPDILGFSPRPAALETYLAFAFVLSAAIGLGGFRRLARGRDLPLPTAAWIAGAATAGPLATLVVAYGRVAELDRSLPFALVAGALALAFTAAAARLRREDTGGQDAVALGVGAASAAAVAAVALGLTFALDRGMLTVAFALAALGTAVITDRVRIPVLRAAVGALGVLVLGRLLYDPTIVGGDPGRTPVFNWLLWGYGVPAASFLAAARILERAGRDRVVRLTEALGIAFAALLVFFEIRHALNEGDPLAHPSGHVEMGLLATASLLFALVTVRVDRGRPDPVSQVASLVFGALALAISATGLLAIANPLLTDEPVVGSVLFNSLLLAFLLPAVLAGMLALAARGVRPDGYVRAAGGLALALQLAWTLLAIRHAFQGPAIGLGRPTGDVEFWTYSVALLLVGVALLALGLWRESRFLRLLSAGYIVAAVVKVFVFDLASLEGVTRALSLIGLGLALVGIGLAYQKLLARRQPPAPGPLGEPA